MRTAVMSEARENVRKVAVVISDGVSTLAHDQTLPEAKRAKADNITIYSIGVTKLIDLNELRRMSSAPQIVNTTYFPISDFNSFATQYFMEKIHETVCVKYDPNLRGG